jgi:hypothetical protein
MFFVVFEFAVLWIRLLSVGLGMGVIFGVVFVFAGLKEFSLTQAIEDTPTAKIDGAADGLTEVNGRFVPEGGKLLRSPISGWDCLYYQLNIQELVRTKNGSYWSTIQSFGYGTPTLFTDGTGYLAIDLAHSDIKLYEGDRKYIVDSNDRAVYLRDQEYRNFVSYLSGLNGAEPDISKSGATLASVAAYKFEIFGGDQVSVLESGLTTDGQYFAVGRIDGTVGTMDGKPIKRMVLDPGTGLLSVKTESKESIERTDKTVSLAVLIFGLVLIIGGLAYFGFR